MIIRTFQKYGTDGGSPIEQPGSPQIPEGDRTSSTARGRGPSRKVPVEPPVSLPFVGEGSSSAGVNDPEKSGLGQRISARL